MQHGAIADSEALLDIEYQRRIDLFHVDLRGFDPKPVQALCANGRLGTLIQVDQDAVKKAAKALA
jgi:hypothetical protein